jgi:hypothetical protein
VAAWIRRFRLDEPSRVPITDGIYVMDYEHYGRMDDRDGSATAPLDRLRSRFGGSDDEDESSEESAW